MELENDFITCFFELLCSPCLRTGFITTLLKPVKNLRQGWAEAFKSMGENNDDALLIPNEVDNGLLEERDESKH
jgi:hypothetical protein